MKTTEERIASIESSLAVIVKALTDAVTHQTKQAFELSVAVAVALEEISRQTGADINMMILVLEKHCEVRQDRDARTDLSLVEGLLARLRTQELGSR